MRVIVGVKSKTSIIIKRLFAHGLECKHTMLRSTQIETSSQQTQFSYTQQPHTHTHTKKEVDKCAINYR